MPHKANNRTFSERRKEGCVLGCFPTTRYDLVEPQSLVVPQCQNNLYNKVANFNEPNL